jgi:hypothetical protein
VNKLAAGRTVQALTKAPAVLLTNPRIGERLFEFEKRKVRRILIGRYEMRYEIQKSTSISCGCGTPERIVERVKCASKGTVLL